jgi:hypothetical protein
MTLLAVLIAVAYVGISSLRDRRNLESARVEFFLKAAEIKNKIKDDIEVAILNNGFTASRNLNAERLQNANTQKYFGLGTSYLTPDMADVELQVFKPFNQSLSVPVQVDIKKVRILGWQNNLDATTKLYWQKAVSSANYFMISNDRKNIIFPRSPQSAFNNSQAEIYPLLSPSVDATPFSSQAAIADFSQASNIIRTVEKVRYNYDSATRRLSRTGHFKQNQSATSIIAERVLNFRVGYTFKAMNDSDPAILPVEPWGDLAAGNLPTSFSEAWAISNCAPGGNPIDATGQVIPACVKPQNINDVYLSFTIETDLPPRAIQNADYEDMQIQLVADAETNRVSAIIDFRVKPRNFSNSLGTELAAGENVNCAPTQANRCKASCSSAFQNLNRGADDWIGYGRYVGHPEGASSYCKCWTDPDTEEVKLGDWASIPQWSTASTAQQKAQTEACGLEYGCHWGTVWKHEGYQLACNCLRTQDGSSDHFVLRAEESRPRFVSKTEAETGGFALRNLNWSDEHLASIRDDGALSRNIRCYNYPVCWAAMTTYFNEIGQGGNLPNGTAENNIFTNRCSCLSNDIPYACDTRAISQGTAPSNECLSTEGEAIARGYVDFNKVCNQAARNNSGPIACVNTWMSAVPSGSLMMPPFNVDLSPNLVDFRNPMGVTLSNDEGLYLGMGSGNFAAKLGISEDLVKACECLEKRVSGQQQGTSFQEVSNSTTFIYPSWPGYVDFREPSTPTQSFSPPGYTRIYATDGSSQDRSVPTYRIISRQQFTDHRVRFADQNCQSMSAWNIYSCNLGGQEVICGPGTWDEAVTEANQATVMGSCRVFSADPNTTFTGVPTLFQRTENDSNTCGANLCMMGFGGTHCCTNQYPDANGLIFDALEEWSGYCRAACGGSQFQTGRVNELRGLITEGDTLPIGCGGSASSGQGEGAL